MTERRKLSWIDYANLGTNIIQIGQLAGIRSRLEYLAQIEAAREERRKLEEQLRQFIFDVEERLKSALPLVKNTPLGLFVALKILSDLLDEVEIVPATFEHFADKDRVKQIRERIAKGIQVAKQEVTETDLEDAIQYLQLSRHLFGLDELISSKAAEEELMHIQGSWEEFLSIHKIEKRKRRASVVLSSALLISFTALCFLISLFEPNTKSSFPLVLGFILFVITTFTFINYESAGPQEYKDMKAKRKHLNRRLLPADKLETFYEKFGRNLSSVQYEQIRNEITQFIQKATTTDKDGSKLPISIIDMLLPEPLEQEEEA